MRYLNLISTLFALNAALQVAAAPAPARATEVVPIPLLGDFTFGMIAPTNIPNIVLPNLPGGGGLPAVPGAPVKRSWNGWQNIGPRFFKNADYQTSSNQSVPVPAAPAPSATTTLERRVTKSKEGHKSSKDRVAASSSAESAGGADAPSPVGAAGNLANTVKSIGSAPKEAIAPAFYSLPIAIPDTPITQADTIAADEQAAAEAPPPPVPQAEKIEEKPGAYTNSNYGGYTSTGSGVSDFKADETTVAKAAPARKRHDMVLDTDPLIPPTDGTKTDPRMGILNVDSNSNPEPHLPAKQPPIPADAPVPDPKATGSLDPVYPDVAHPPPTPGAPVPPSPPVPAPAPVPA